METVITTCVQDFDELQREAEVLIETEEALSQMPAGVSEGETQAISIGLENLLGCDVLASAKSIKGNQLSVKMRRAQLAQESIGETIRNLWKKFIDFLKQMWAAFMGMFDAIERRRARLENRASAIVTKREKEKMPTRTSDEANENVKKYFKILAPMRGGPTSNIEQVVSTLQQQYTESGRLAKALEDALKKFVDLTPEVEKNKKVDIDKLSDITDEAFAGMVFEDRSTKKIHLHTEFVMLSYRVQVSKDLVRSYQTQASSEGSIIHHHLTPFGKKSVPQGRKIVEIISNKDVFAHTKAAQAHAEKLIKELDKEAKSQQAKADDSMKKYGQELFRFAGFVRHTVPVLVTHVNGLLSISENVVGYYDEGYSGFNA